ncbi:hypothetical protein BHU72_03630 [Desulfuribacillus stibiiarsenatis]|uniref:4Fe-4S ferredoxin-type domain-containing protein n=2 Tax=Desulfuribacillus stibiiarsenatis TaxID=1390249 RepID=A0A1E5L764_9FIRM|nr:hypothetical protein BHU72_03630 [Desulfuribacillus stibiiarsenatis]
MLGYIGKTAGINKKSKFLRPPGAIDELEFISTCLRCGKCQVSCQKGCIEILDQEKGIGLGTPYIQYKNQSCDFCLECIKVCRSGALLHPEDTELVIGNAHIHQYKCLAWQGAICNNCVHSCKNKAIKLKDNRYPDIIEELCRGCGACMIQCFQQPTAIFIQPKN